MSITLSHFEGRTIRYGIFIKLRWTKRIGRRSCPPFCAISASSSSHWPTSSALSANTRWWPNCLRHLPLFVDKLKRFWLSSRLQVETSLLIFFITSFAVVASSAMQQQQHRGQRRSIGDVSSPQQNSTLPLAPREQLASIPTSVTIAESLRPRQLMALLQQNGSSSHTHIYFPSLIRNKYKIDFIRRGIGAPNTTKENLCRSHFLRGRTWPKTGSVPIGGSLRLAS
jgi:hypothetical protein